MVADDLRRELPDLDDVTIGRVVHAVARQVHSAVASADVTMDVASLWTVLAAIGLQMTRNEWDEG